MYFEPWNTWLFMMPGVKQRTVRRKTICPPHKRKGSHKQESASRKKLVKSPSGLFSKKKKEAKQPKLADQQGMTVILEKSALQATLEDAVLCKHCLSGPVRFEEDDTQSNGLGTHSYLFCEACKVGTLFPFTKLNGKSLMLNRKAVFANKCIGGTRTSLKTFCAILDLPAPVMKQGPL